MHTTSLGFILWVYQLVCEGLLNIENECKYDLTYLDNEHLNDFHGNPAPL